MAEISGRGGLERPGVAWVMRKLASQPPGYLPRRLSYAARKRWVDAVFPTRRMRARATFRLPGGDAPDTDLRTYLLERSGPAWHFGPHEHGAVARRIPEPVRRRTRAEADELADRTFRFRGHGPVRLDAYRWERAHEGDPLWRWDLNRHMWFSILGFAHAYTGEAHYVEAFRRAAGSWIDAHGTHIGRLPGETPFEVAARMNAWLWAWHLFLPCEAWADAERRRFLATLGRMAEYLHHAIEYHSPGNHLLLEAKSLVLCGEVFPEFEGSGAWRSRGWRSLRRELRAQICPDGVHAERSTMYHRIVAGELAELWCFCRRNGHAEAAGLEGVVGRMAGFLDWIRAGEELPLLGDAHRTDSYARFDAVRLVEAASGREGGPPASSFDGWIRGENLPPVVSGRPAGIGAGPEAEEPGPDTEPPDSRPALARSLRGKSFPVGGYHVVRSGPEDASDVLVWDCGPPGHPMNLKHAHADALSFTLTLGGRPFLVDPGIDEGPRRLRATAFHNTVLVGGHGQGVLAPRGEIWSPPRGALLHWSEEGGAVVMAGRHDGFRHLDPPASHARGIVVHPERYWLILDWVDGGAEETAEVRFHLAPGLEPRFDVGGGASVVREEEPRALLRVAGLGADPGAPEPTVEIRREEAFAELDCGVREPTHLLVQRWTSRSPFLVATLVAADPTRSVDLRLDHTATGAVTRISRAGRRDEVVLQGPGPLGRPASEGTGPPPILVRRRVGAAREERRAGEGSAEARRIR